MTLPVSRIDTVFVPALDPAKAAAWYRRVLGLVTVFEEPDYVALRFPGDGPRRSTALTLRRVGTIDLESHPAFNFFTDDPVRLHAGLVDQVETTPIMQSGGMRHFDFRDPSGNWINVCSFEEQN